MEAARGIVRRGDAFTTRHAGLALVEGQGSDCLLFADGGSGAPILDFGQVPRRSIPAGITARVESFGVPLSRLR
jgi:hypothetical protein